MKLFLPLIFALILWMPAASQAQSVIRDSEIEITLKTWSEPIFRAAGLSTQQVNIIIINDPRVNAFVAGGANIFLFTGLFDRAETPEEIIGVIAHETGHIAGGHLVRLRGSMEQASFETIIGTILGIGAAVLTGEGAAAGAIISGSQQIATRRFLAHSRLNESSADQAALDLMTRAGIDPGGLVTFLEKLEGDELLPQSQQSEYARTHPITGNRIEALRRGAAESSAAGTPLPAGWYDQYERITAKLTGFLSPEQVSWQYDETRQDIPALYARAIAAYRQNEVELALRLIADLVEREPQNPYFNELKGQMLVDFGRIKQALPFYARAVDLAPRAPLMRMAYAHALIEEAGRENPDQLRAAINQLKVAEQSEKRSARLHRLLATAHGRLGEEVSAQLHLAEEAFLQQRIKDAERFATIARDNAAQGSRAWIRASDILNAIERDG